MLPPSYPMSGIVAYRDLNSEFWYAPPLREIVNSYYFQENERLPQYQGEYVLRERMGELPNVEARFGWSAETIRQDDSGVNIAIAENGGGARDILRADYVVGCDGGHSITPALTASTMDSTMSSTSAGSSLRRSKGEAASRCSRPTAKSGGRFLKKPPKTSSRLASATTGNS